MISLKDIARECGVSVATVSKALNGQKDIGADTRKRICDKASEMGYLMNAAARALKTNRSYNIGVLFTDLGGRGLTHEFFASVLDSFKVEAEHQGYDITFLNNSVAEHSTSFLQHCLYRGFDGVAVICVDFFDPRVQELINSDLPVVTVDHVFNNRLAVISDNVSGLEVLVRYAYGKGHRKIAYIFGERTSVTQNRLTGFYRACEELDIQVPEEYVRAGAYYDSEQAYRIAREILTLEDPPTCIIFPDDFSLIGGMKAIYEQGLNVPGDISVMGYDGIVVSQVMTPKITTYRQNASQIGKTAAEKLISQITHPRTTVLGTTVIPGELIEGESVSEI